MAFKRTRIKNGRPYTYWEERYRENGKVKSRHLGKNPLRFIPQHVAPEQRGLAYIERQMEKYPGDPFAAKAAQHQQAKDKLSKELGVTFPKDNEVVVPAEKTSSEVSTAREPDAEAGSADEGGEGQGK